MRHPIDCASCLLSSQAVRWILDWPYVRRLRVFIMKKSEFSGIRGGAQLRFLALRTRRGTDGISRGITRQLRFFAPGWGTAKRIELLGTKLTSSGFGMDLFPG